MFVLSEGDVRVITTSLVEAKNIRADTPRFNTDKPHEMSPEAYIAKGTGTIPAATLDGFGGINVAKAFVKVYKINVTGDEIIPVLLPNGKQKELEVVNIHLIEISAGVYVSIKRDKYGTWLIECFCGCDLELKF